MDDKEKEKFGVIIDKNDQDKNDQPKVESDNKNVETEQVQETNIKSDEEKQPEIDNSNENNENSSNENNLAKNNEDEIKKLAAFTILYLRLIGAPISWSKTVLGQSFTWTGYNVNTKEFEVGIPPEKMQLIAEGVCEVLDTKNGKIPFESFQRLTHRFGWWARCLPWIRPYLKKWYAEVSRVRSILEQKAKKLVLLSSQKVFLILRIRNT